MAWRGTNLSKEAIPRPEYPRPQFERAEWLCLNGPWEFEIDQGDSGIQRGVHERTLNDEILVPFCPESDMSGIANTDYLNAVWYRRTVQIPQSWGDRNLLLHFQAVDYDATVWVDGVEVGRHRGGFTPRPPSPSGQVGNCQPASAMARHHCRTVRSGSQFCSSQARTSWRRSSRRSVPEAMARTLAMVWWGPPAGPVEEMAVGLRRNRGKRQYWCPIRRPSAGERT